MRGIGPGSGFWSGLFRAVAGKNGTPHDPQNPGSSSKWLEVNARTFEETRATPGVINFGSINVRGPQRERGTVRLACGACGHPARSLRVRDLRTHLPANTGQDARWPHRRDALCYDSPSTPAQPVLDLK